MLDVLFPLFRSNDDCGRAAVFRDFLRPFRFCFVEQFAELCLGFSDRPGMCSQELPVNSAR